MTIKVFVSGCFDLLHSGHIQFFQTAATYGDLYVALGADKTIFDLKGRLPVNNEEERLYMVQSISCVKSAFISSGSGILDFEKELKKIKPEIFVVNEDGNIPEKEKLCRDFGIRYIVLKREPASGLTPRSTTSLRNINLMPYRIDVAGGWLDQPWVSELCAGPVITVSIEPTFEFNERSGMASSTRLSAIDLWGPRLPVADEKKLAKILFCYDNPPGTKEVSGSQDSIGIVCPGLNKSYYEGKYWPSKIESVQDETLLQFIEKSFYLVPLGPRHSGYAVLSNTRITAEGAKALSTAAESCWGAILAKDIHKFGKYFKESFEAQVSMFPNMINNMVVELIDHYKDSALGWKLSGAGGGGYLILVSDKPVEHALQITIRRVSD